MTRRILFGCRGVPFSSDANAYAYNLFERMRRDGLDVVHANLISEADAFFFRYSHGEDFEDPRRLASVRSCTIEEPVLREQPALSDLIRSWAPDLLVAWGVDAAVLLRNAAPDLPLVLVASGCRQLEHLIEEGAVRDWLSFRRAAERGVKFPLRLEDREVAAVLRSGLLILTSLQARFAFGHFFPSQVGRIYARTLSPADLVDDEAERFADLRRPFAERDVDLLFADGDWRPRSKNLDLVRRIASRLGDLEVHVVGEHHEPVRRAHVHGLPRQRRDLYALLGRTKVLACPALSDAGPGVLFEAAAMGCNVVASASSGYAELCGDELRVTGSRDSEFAERIRRGISRPFDDNRQPFLGGTADLVETLSVF